MKISYVNHKINEISPHLKYIFDKAHLWRCTDILLRHSTMLLQYFDASGETTTFYKNKPS